MDETAFVSEYYNKNKQHGVEIIGLVYDNINDWDRSLRSLRKFQERYKVQYPNFNTEVTVQDSLRTE